MSGPIVMAAAEALMRHGNGVYGDDIECTEDAMTWLRSEAEDLAALWPCSPDAVAGLLEDTAWWDPTEENAARAHAVHADIAARFPT